MKRKLQQCSVIMSLACIQLAGCGQEEKKTEDNKKQKLSRARQKRRAKQRRITKKQKRKILMRQTRRSQM